MARANSGNGILLDWVNVTYRSVAWSASLVLLTVIGGYFGWQFMFQRGPERQAEEAIAAAESQLTRAKALQGDEIFDEICRSSRIALIEAHGSYEQRDWNTSIIAAVRSENLATRALNRVGGEATDQVVRVHRLEGDVRVKRVGEFSWTRADNRMKLHEGDQVKTGASGSVQLIYFDGTETTIRPGSLMEVQSLFEDPLTKVRRVSEKLNFGQLEASTPGVNVKGSYHEVATENVSARVEEQGDVRVNHEKSSGRSSFDALSGSAMITSPGSRELLNEGERISADREGKFSAKQRIPGIPRQIAPSDQKVFLQDRAKPVSLQISWDSVKSADRYRLMISNKPLFADSLYDRIRRDISVTLEQIPPGDYFWKVAAVNDKGVAGPFSPARRFRVSHHAVHDRTDTVPPELKIEEFMPFGSMVVVRGRTEPGSSLWINAEKVEVAKDGNFSSVIRLKREGSNDVRFVAQDAAGNETVESRSTVVESF